MANLFILISCLIAGLLFRRTGRVPENGHLMLNAVIIHLSLPAVTLRTLHGFNFDTSQFWPVLMPWAMFALGAGVFWALGRWLHLPSVSVQPSHLESPVEA